MKLIRWSVDHPAAVLSVYAALIVLSALSLLYLIPVRLTPAIDSPQLMVRREVMGMPAEYVERTVTTPIESALATVGGVRYLRSVSMRGMSTVTLEFPYHYDMRRAEAEVSAAVAGLGPPTVTRLDPLNIPVLRVAVRAPNRSPASLQTWLDTVVTARLRQVPGVDSVYTVGGPARQIGVMIDRDKLEARGLSVTEVRAALETALRSRVGGTLNDVASETMQVRFNGQPASVRDLESVRVGIVRGRPVTLREVAHVDPAMDSDQPLYRCNGRDAIELNVVQRGNASSPHTIKGVREALDALVRANPGVEFEVAYDNAHFVEIVERNVWIELILAVLLTGAVVFVFLGDVRGTLIAVATVPTSLACAAALFVPLGLSLDSSTLIGLLLAIGRLVDDTIIDLHAVQRHRAMGKDARNAAIDGCSEVRRAVIAATVVICLAMLPLTFAGGLTQDMFTGIVWPFLLSLLASLGVALTLTPLLASWAYRGERPLPRPSLGQRLLDRLEVRYRRALVWGLNHRGIVLSGVFSVCYLAWMTFPLIGSEMMPLSDTGQIYCVLEARPGTTTAETSHLTRQLEEILRRQPEVQRVSAEIGAVRGGRATGYDCGGSNSAVLLITLTDKDSRRRTIWDIADAVHDEAMRTIPHLRRLALKEMGSDVMASAMAPIELVIHGPDLGRIDWLAEQTRALAEKMPGLKQTATAWTRRQAAWTVDVDESSADAVGLTPAEVAQQAAEALDGVELAARMADGGTVMIGYRDSQRRNVRDLANMTIVGRNRRVPLRFIATLKRGTAPDVIAHDNLQRSNSVMGSYRNGGPGSMQLSMDLLMASRMQLPYPAAYDIEQRGDMTQMMDAFNRLLWGLGIALALMYLSLVVQFGSAILPLAIMAAIPLEMPGVFIGLLLAHQTFSTVSLLGIVVLNGMDVTASILVLDAVLARRAAGREVRDALLEGAPTRLRPVLMTVAVTLAVMIPLAFFPRTGMDAYAPLATVVVGGLTMSTILTLGVVPILYSLLDGRRHSPITMDDV